MMSLTESGGGSDAEGNMKTDRDAGAKGVTAFIVEPKKSPGWKAQPVDMMGLSNAFRTNVLFLDDFVVPVENRLGQEGEGFKIIGLVSKVFPDAELMAGTYAFARPAGRRWRCS